MAVRRLDSRTIDRIAAGEVVERPASVVKELIENSLDAGASRIEVEISAGGMERIRVRDDGSGMTRGDAVLSVERHATSKIRSEADLARVSSYGFRGEALPSIASVSRFTLTTSDGSSPEGTRISIDHGAPPKVAPAAHPRGTEVLVEDLFAKTPARRKFLKSPEAESREVARAVTRAALGARACAFSLVSNGRTLVDVPSASDVASRIVGIFGSDTLGELLRFEARAGEINVTGYATRGSTTFASRRFQFLFVNGRPVQDRGISRAVTEAAREAIRTTRHPGVFLYLTVPTGSVDINVSPAKTEVRFASASEVFRLIFHSVLSALSAGKEERRIVPVPAATDFSIAEATEVYAAAPERIRPSGGRVLRLEPGRPASAAGRIDVEVTPAPRLAALAQYDDSYILAQGERELFVVDQHAAHERVLYERLRGRIGQGRGFSQALLAPAVFEASPEQAAVLSQNLDVLAEAGFDVEPLSGRSYSIAAVPSETGGKNPLEIFPDLVESLGSGSSEPEQRRDRLTATIACRSAITIHRRLAREEMERLVADWTKLSDRYTCPHGRPIVLSLSDADLETFFKRR